MLVGITHTRPLYLQRPATYNPAPLLPKLPKLRQRGIPEHSMTRQHLREVIITYLGWAKYITRNDVELLVKYLDPLAAVSITAIYYTRALVGTEDEQQKAKGNIYLKGIAQIMPPQQLSIYKLHDCYHCPEWDTLGDTALLERAQVAARNLICQHRAKFNHAVKQETIKQQRERETRQQALAMDNPTSLLTLLMHMQGAMQS